MKVRTKRKICGVISFLGMMLMIGAVSDVNLVSLQRIVIQALIGLALFAGGSYKGGWMA